MWTIAGGILLAFALLGAAFLVFECFVQFICWVDEKVHPTPLGPGWHL